MELLIGKIRQDLKSIPKKDFRFEIVYLKRDPSGFAQNIDCTNALIYVYYVECINSTVTTYLKSKECKIAVNNISESVYKFTTDLKVDANFSKIKYVKVRLIR